MSDRHQIVMTTAETKDRTGPVDWVQQGQTPDDSANEEVRMRALVQDRYGTADVWELSAIGLPMIGTSEVLVKVRAAGMDRGTWHLLTGLPYLMRLMGFGFRRPKNRVPGLDVAGTVIAVGSDVTRFRPGDDVFGSSRGSFAQYTAAREDELAHKPANVTFEEAAVVTLSGMTALQALRDAGRVAPGDTVLVIGASGGVGSYAVQLAKSMGAKVTGVASTSKLDLVRSLGADETIDYTCEDFAGGTTRYDVILDIGGSSPVSRLRRALTAEGTLVMVGGESGGRLTGGFDRQLRAVALSAFVRQRLRMVTAQTNHRDLEVLAAHLESGQVVSAVDRSHPLEQAAEAMKRLAAGQARGKLAITI